MLPTSGFLLPLFVLTNVNDLSLSRELLNTECARFTVGLVCASKLGGIVLDICRPVTAAVLF